MSGFPPDMPATAEEAFARIGRVAAPSVDDLKLMVLLEASGQGFYGALAAASPNAEVRALLEKNAQEELGHAHRVSRAIERLTGTPFAVPSPGDNPYWNPPQGLAPHRALLEEIAQGEFGGERLYETWAASLADPVASALLRENGREERLHGERAQQAIGLLAG